MNDAFVDRDRVVEWLDLPLEIRAEIGPALPLGHTVWACLCKKGCSGAHIEWWWLDETGELVEAFWFE